MVLDHCSSTRNVHYIQLSRTIVIVQKDMSPSLSMGSNCLRSVVECNHEVWIYRIGFVLDHP